MLFDFRLLHSFCKQCFQQSFSQRLVQEWWSTIILSISLSPFLKKEFRCFRGFAMKKRGQTQKKMSLSKFSILFHLCDMRKSYTTIDKERPKGFNQNGIYWLLVNWEKRYCPKKAWNMALVGLPLETIQKASKLPLIFLGGKGSLSARVWVHQLIPNNNRNIKD